MKNVIYHYCSLDTFNIIMRNKTIRLSDITKSNDSKEKQLIYDHLRSAIDQAFGEIKLSVRAMDPIETGFAEGYTYLDFFRKDLLEVSNQSSLVACFSRDGDLLSQWRGYANDGCGFAIGFDKMLLEQYLRRDERFRVEGIKYDAEGQLRMIDNDVKEAFLDCVEWNGLDLDFSKYIGIFNDEIDDISYDLAERLDVTSCLMKNQTFQEENEVRIIFSSGIGINTDQTRIEKKIVGTTKLCLKDVDYLVRNNQLVLYADMSFKNALPDRLIKDIIIGPKVNMTVEEVKNYLWICGYEDINVRKSYCTYR